MLTNRVELVAAYSPAPHVLVQAGYQPQSPLTARNDTTKYVQINQYELAAGPYSIAVTCCLGWRFIRYLLWQKK